MSTAHIFYIPVLVLVGIFAGYYIGRQAAEDEARERIKKRRREAALKQAAQPTNDGSEE